MLNKELDAFKEWKFLKGFIVNHQRGKLKAVTGNTCNVFVRLSGYLSNADEARSIPVIGRLLFLRSVQVCVVMLNKDHANHRIGARAR